MKIQYHFQINKYVFPHKFQTTHVVTLQMITLLVFLRVFLNGFERSKLAVFRLQMATLYKFFCYRNNNFFDTQIVINIIEPNHLSEYTMPYVTSYVRLINSNNPPINQYSKLNVAERQTEGRKPY